MSVSGSLGGSSQRQTGPFVQRDLMIAKRFLLSSCGEVQYLELSSDNRPAATTRYILFMDIDNVVANRLQPFLDAYYRDLMGQYSFGNLTNTSSFFAYEDPGGQTNAWHTGLNIHHREYSMGCLDGWRHEMDKQRHGWDQPLLLRGLENFTLYNCALHSLPEEWRIFLEALPN